MSKKDHKHNGASSDNGKASVAVSADTQEVAFLAHDRVVTLRLEQRISLMQIRVISQARPVVSLLRAPTQGQTVNTSTSCEFHEKNVCDP